MIQYNSLTNVPTIQARRLDDATDRTEVRIVTLMWRENKKSEISDFILFRVNTVKGFRSSDKVVLY